MQLKHRFYNKSKSEQNRIQTLIAVSALGIVFLSIVVAWITKVYFLGFLAIPIVLTIIAPFFDTPSLKKSGKLIYHSPLFLSERPKKEVIKIHGGTLFDYVFVINKKMNGKQRTDFIIQQYLQGLLNLMEEYKNKTNENLTIRGTSYIVNERTAQRIGFKIVETDFIQRLILSFNYFNILTTYSIAKNKLSFPKLSTIITFEAKLNDLSDRKDFLRNLNNKLKSTIAANVKT